MGTLDPFEKRGAVLEVARQAGYTVSETQLARWHRAGLLPAPKQRHLGKGKGTETLYPAGTGQQLLALCSLRDKEGRLDLIAWALWWQGFEVEITLAREFLQGTAARVDQFLEKLRDGEDLSEAAWDEIDQCEKARMSKAPYRRVRRNTGTKEFPVFVRVILEVGAGVFNHLPAHPRTGKKTETEEITERALGLERAREDRLPGIEPWLSGGIEGALAAISGLMKVRAWHSLSEADDADLLTMRDEVRTFLNGMESARRFFGEIFGPGAFGFAFFSDCIRDMKPRGQAFILLMWPALRKLAPADSLNTLLATCKRCVPEYEPNYELLKTLRSQVPALRNGLRPIMLRRAMLDHKAMQKHNARLARLASEHREEIDTVLASRPKR